MKNKTKDIRIIEVFTNRQVNTETHRKLWTGITKELMLFGKLNVNVRSINMHIKRYNIGAERKSCIFTWIYGF